MITTRARAQMNKEFPPMQAPETYNLDGILKQMQQSGHNGHD